MLGSPSPTSHIRKLGKEHTRRVQNHRTINVGCKKITRRESFIALSHLLRQRCGDIVSEICKYFKLN